MTIMKKTVFTWILTLAATLVAGAQGSVSVQFYTPTTVRIVKGGAAPPLTIRTVVGL